MKKEEKKEMTKEFLKCDLSKHTFINAELVGKNPEEHGASEKRVKKNCHSSLNKQC